MLYQGRNIFQQNYCAVGMTLGGGGGAAAVLHRGWRRVPCLSSGTTVRKVCGSMAPSILTEWPSFTGQGSSTNLNFILIKYSSMVPDNVPERNRRVAINHLVIKNLILSV